MNSLIIALVAWWIAEGSNLVQTAKHLAKWERRLKPFDCPLCLAFWMGLFFDLRLSTMDAGFGFFPVQAIICSSLAMLISKIYYRI